MSSRAASAAAKQIKSHFFQHLPGWCTMDCCYTGNTLAGSCTFMKKWMPRHPEQAWIENHPEITCSGGTDVDNQLGVLGVAFSLTLDLFNDPW